MNAKIPHKCHCYFCGQTKLKLNTLKMQIISLDHRARYIHIKLSETHQLFNTILFFPHYVHISCEGNDLWDDHFVRLKKMSLKHYFARKECVIIRCTACLQMQNIIEMKLCVLYFLKRKIIFIRYAESTRFSNFD